ncbi:hypothetical protein AB4392_05170 [Vibrio breoganii]
MEIQSKLLPMNYARKECDHHIEHCLKPIDTASALYGKYREAHVSRLTIDGKLMMFYVNHTDPHFSFYSERNKITVGIIGGEPQLYTDLQFWSRVPEMSQCSEATTPLYCLNEFIRALLVTNLSIAPDDEGRYLKMQVLGKLASLANRCDKAGYLNDPLITQRPLLHQDCRWRLDPDSVEVSD